jgi:photosystem II stability/assembly factor-like uncharacterized protein
MYILIAAALAISLFITAAPAQKVSGDCTADVCAEWERVATPTMDGFVLAPESTIYDYALASDGEVAYAVVYAYPEDADGSREYRLLKSDDHAATWTDITDALEDVDDAYNITELVLVATDWEDPDFVAVALVENGEVRVYFSTDGGDNFEDAGEVEDTVYFSGPDDVSDLVVSHEADGKRDIAIGGTNNVSNPTDARLFRCTVTGDSPGAWKDATAYDGWDNEYPPAGPLFTSILVTDLIVSPDWAEDRTILAVTIDDVGSGNYTVYLQSGTFGKTGGSWNAAADFANAVPVKSIVDLPMWLSYSDARGIAGVTLPLDYSGADPDLRYAWVWVNYNVGATEVGEILRVRNDSVDPVDTQISKMPWLTNVSYLGYIAEGKAIAGVLGDGAADYEDCCVGVNVYRNDGITNMEICCLEWEKACKPPTGRAAMAVSYVSNDPATSKAYAVALQDDIGYDEGAWSVTFDDGDTWNQLSLIDTSICYLSDVAVSPDCNKMMLVSVNLDDNKRGCGCDSVWLKADTLPEAEEYSGQWLRTWCGKLLGDNAEDGGHRYFPWASERGLLRLAPEETTGDTVYLVDRMTGTIYYNALETLACWTKRSSATEIDEIVDLVVKDESTIYALDWNGDVAMSDNHGSSLSWTEAVDSEVDYGWTIAVHGDDILVGGQNGDVSHSDDGGETFTALEDVDDDSSAHVTVAFDTYFDQNDTIYAALANASEDNGGIYLWVADNQTSEKWFKLAADDDLNYTGLVLDRPSPANPYTSPETGGVLYASFYAWWTEDVNCDYCDAINDGYCWYSGVARCLTPIVELCCGVGEAEWDYLTWGLTSFDDDGAKFIMTPQALKICGCLTADSNSKLFAIGRVQLGDSCDYDMDEGQDGTVWTFEDCYAKKAVELVSPADGFVVGVDTCDCCNAPFAIRWDRLCDACCYEVQFALDEDFTEIYEPYAILDSVDGIYFDWYCPAKPTAPSLWVGCYFDPEFTYYWRIRAVEAETCQEIHSWWSDPMSFTVAPTAWASEIDLVSPVPGAQGVAVKNVGFSWNLAATADAFDWVLSPNADLSAHVDSKIGLNATACTYTGTLSYGTTYYWQVTAYNEGAAISMSAVGTFTTAAQGAFCCPQCGLCFATQAELQTHIADAHPAQPATPPWVWVIIAIGAVLVIVVIVLIFRTRRV